MTSFNAESAPAAPTAVTFDTNVLAARAQAAQEAQQAASAKAPVNADEARSAAEAAVMAEVVSARLGGDARLFKRWAANNASYLKYRVGLKSAELQGKTGGDTVDTDRLRLAVAASAAGGELKRDGSVKGVRSDESLQTAAKATASQAGRWRPYGGALIDTTTGTVMTKQQAKRLGWIEKGAK